MPVTSKEIARILGISQPTVSRILNGAPGHRVSPETRARVLETAKELDYRPNAVARSLRRRRTNIIGFYSGYATLDTRHDFIGTLVAGLQHACDDRGLDVLLHGSHRGRDTDQVYGELVDGRVDGLLFHGALNNPLIKRLAASSLPVLALVDVMEGIPSVVADNADGMRILIDHLWSHGHRTIAYLIPQIKFDSVETRILAFSTEMARRGASKDNAPLVSIPIEETTGVFEYLQTLNPRPTAICCWNDRAAYDLLWKCVQSGISIPGDLAICGFDGFIESKLPVLDLTTVFVPYEQIASTAVELLMQRIEDLPVPNTTTLPVTLHCGNTV